MQQVSYFRRQQYATSIPDAVVVINDPASFLPATYYVKCIKGTIDWVKFVYVTNVMGANGATVNIASIIMQYAEDPLPKLIKCGAVPVTRAVHFLSDMAMTYWNAGLFDDAPVYIPCTLNHLYLMVENIQDWMHIAEESGQEDSMINLTLANCEKIKRFILSGTTKMFIITPLVINVEGTREFKVLFSNFWIWYERMLDNFFRA